MNIVVYHRNGFSGVLGTDFFQAMLSMAPLAQMVKASSHVDLSGYSFAGSHVRGESLPTGGETVYVIPEDWAFAEHCQAETVVGYADSPSLTALGDTLESITPWNLVLNGNYAMQFDTAVLAQILDRSPEDDVIAVKVQTDLRGFRENAILTDSDYIAGFRRYFEDAWQPAPTPRQWPQVLLLNRQAMRTVLELDSIPLSYEAFMRRLTLGSLSTKTLAVAGCTYNLCDEGEFLAYFQTQSRSSAVIAQSAALGYNAQPGSGAVGTVSLRQPRLVGRVFVDKHARVDPGAVILGPSVIGEGAWVKPDAIVDSAIVGPGVTVDEHRLVRNCVLTHSALRGETSTQSSGGIQEEARFHWPDSHDASRQNCFRLWPRLSYPRLIKRAGDMVVALIAIVLFLPLLPVIALAVKLSSPGPVFYRARRQGRYGKDFDCLKFRTMKVGADQIQEKLRTVSEVDGPQFKMADDPRITTVGRFLRDTFLDEMPQFYNVLRGQMSVVGPRPSPKSENVLCPLWRDARLSVRPGVTGLWQVNRTREPMLDFQEWIHYDTEYIRRISFKLDVGICWCTLLQMLGKFAEKFVG